MDGYNFTHLYPPFLREAFRVLKCEGVLFCKIADYIHDHRYQWAHIEVVGAAVEAGFCPCDCIVKIRKGPIVDPRWKTAPTMPGGSIATGWCSASQASAGKLALTEVLCPKCGQVLAGSDVNVGTHIARCRRCDEVFVLSSLVQASASGPVNLDDPPRGAGTDGNSTGSSSERQRATRWRFRQQPTVHDRRP